MDGNIMNGSDECNPVDKVELVHEEFGEIKRLEGFRKQNKAPDAVSDFHQKMLCEASFSMLDNDLEETFGALRSAFKFKRKEISVSGPEDGAGSISTTFFNYEIAISQQADRPSHYCCRRAINEITDPGHTFCEAFDSVFGDRFSVLEIGAKRSLDIEAIVDRVEEVEPESIQIDYDKDVTWCKIQVETAATPAMEIEIHENVVKIVSDSKVKPAELLEGFLVIQQEFITKLELGSGWFTA